MIMTMRTALALLGILVLGSIGCARFEYDVVRPEEFAGRAPTRVDYIVERDPLEYRLRAVGGRLVVRIYNQSEESITLLGSQSTVVDPTGQSRPLITQTIAPQSFIKIMLPPPRPRVYQTGPSIGIGVGGTYRRAGYEGYNEGYNGGFNDFAEPRYLAVYDESSPVFWEWRGEGQVRLTLVFARAGGTFTHDFVIARVRV